MIERTIIHGRPASVVYVDDQFNPVQRDAATLIKVLFDDGGVVFGVPNRLTARARGDS